ncbi:MAG: DNA-processing protein DprA [Eubacteriales bacterium]|nr:DNA-processing protein DprA [Eubacteriales bacterium]
MEIDAHLWLAHVREIGPETHKKRRAAGLTPETLYHTDEWQSDTLHLFTPLQRAAMLREKRRIAAIIRATTEKDISFYPMEDPNRPPPDSLARLTDIDLPPFAVFVRGRLPAVDRPAVAMVGSRRPSAHGLQTAYRLALELAPYCTVISGMALGIDVQSHIGALDAGGQTIAVTGCGLDRCYPQSNFSTYMRLLEKGTLISEYPPGTPPYPFHFPARNRLISALADVILVVEAKHKSGTTHTVRHALSRNKDIFAVPGRITDEQSAGCLELIRDGAHPLISARDILEHFQIRTDTPQREAGPVALILNAMTDTMQNIDALTGATGLNFAELAAHLLKMEQAGLVEVPVPGFYVRRRRPR